MTRTSRHRPVRSRGTHRPWLATAVATGAILGAIALTVWWRVRAGLDDPVVVHGTVRPGEGDPGPGDGVALRTANIRLRLIDTDGEPIAGAVVVLDGEHGSGNWTFSPAGAVTDPLGQVFFNAVPFGRWPVLLPDPKIALDRGRILAVGSDETPPGSTIEFDVPVERREAVHGRIVDPQTNPVPYVGLILHLRDGDRRLPPQTARSDIAGSFEFYLPAGVHPTVRAQITSTQYRPGAGQPMTFAFGENQIQVVVEFAVDPTLG